MVKVVSTAKRAVAVRCIGCGINAQLQRGYSCQAQMAMTFNCHGPQGCRRREKEKPDKKEIIFGLYFALHRQISSYVTCHFAIPVSLFVSSYVSSGHVFSSFPFQFSWFSVILQHTVTENKKFQAYTCLHCARRGQRMTS